METAQRLETLIEKLKKRGYRLTPQRMAVLRILTESTSHPSVEEVYEKVRVDFPMTSLATIYKTVTMLKEEGEILELGFGSGGSRYDAARPYPHPHLICVGCQKIIDPEIHLIDELPQELSQKYGFQITNHRVDFFGLCPECQQQAAQG